MPLKIQDDTTVQSDQQAIANYFEEISEVIAATQQIKDTDLDKMAKLAFDLTIDLSRYILAPSPSRPLDYIDIDLFKRFDDKITFHMSPSKITIDPKDRETVINIVHSYAKQGLPLVMHYPTTYPKHVQDYYVNTAFKNIVLEFEDISWADSEITNVAHFFEAISQPTVINELLATSGDDPDNHPITNKVFAQLIDEELDSTIIISPLPELIAALKNFIQIIVTYAKIN